MQVKPISTNYPNLELKCSNDDFQPVGNASQRLKQIHKSIWIGKKPRIG